MPLRYAYEAMIVSQAVRNPVRSRAHPPATPDRPRPQPRSSDETRTRRTVSNSPRKDSAACSPPAPPTRRRPPRWSPASGRIASSGTRIEVETMKVWPEQRSQSPPGIRVFRQRAHRPHGPRSGNLPQRLPQQGAPRRLPRLEETPALGRRSSCQPARSSSNPPTRSIPRNTAVSS